MKNIFENAVNINKNIDIAMPIIDLAATEMVVREGHVLRGCFFVNNSNATNMILIAESTYKYIVFEKEIYEGNQIEITYSVDSKKLVEAVNEEEIVLTYNGGEEIIPVTIRMIKEDHQNVEEKTTTISRVKPSIVLSLTQKAFHNKDSVELTVWNERKEPISIRVKDDKGYIKPEDEIIVKDETRIKLPINIPQKDIIFGKVPLKTNPKIDMTLYVACEIEGEEVTDTVEFCVTNLSALKASEAISGYKQYIETLSVLRKNYFESIKTEEKFNWTKMLSVCKKLVNYDYSQIEFRLFYIYLLIECKKKNEAVKLINELKNYSLYYDMVGQEVDSILMCFIGLLNNEDVTPLILRWRGTSAVWWKIILKSHLLKRDKRVYDDFYSLRARGIDNVYTRAEAIVCLNKHPFIPMKEDEYYKELINWAIEKDVIGHKLVKYIESHYNRMLLNNNIDCESCEYIYEDMKSNNALKLLCTTYIQTNRRDEKAFEIFEKTLRQKFFVRHLYLNYIMAAYNCKKFIDVKLLGLSVKIDSLEKRFQQYFYYTLRVKRDDNMKLYRLYQVKLSDLDVEISELRDYPIPENNEEINNLFEYVDGENNVDLVKYLLLRYQKTNFIGSESYLKGIESIRKEECYAARLAAYVLKKGYYNTAILMILKENLPPRLDDMLKVHRAMKEKGIVDTEVIYKIVYKSLLMNAFDEEIIHIFIRNKMLFIDDLSYENILEKVASLFLVNDFSFDEVLGDLFKEIIDNKENKLIELALLKSCWKRKKSEELTKRLLLKHINQDIIFPWFKELLEVHEIDYVIRQEKFFEYIGKEDSDVYLIYRINEEDSYTTVKMKHIASGLFICSVLVFYNEAVQYYIKEVEQNHYEDIKVSDIYFHNTVKEFEHYIDKYDIINTILIAQEIEDEESMDYEIATYFEYDNIKYKGLKML